MKVFLLVLAGMGFAFGILDLIGILKATNIIEGLLWINFAVYYIGEYITKRIEDKSK